MPPPHVLVRRAGALKLQLQLGHEPRDLAGQIRGERAWDLPVGLERLLLPAGALLLSRPLGRRYAVDLGLQSGRRGTRTRSSLHEGDHPEALAGNQGMRRKALFGDAAGHVREALVVPELIPEGSTPDLVEGAPVSGDKDVAARPEPFAAPTGHNGYE